MTAGSLAPLEALDLLIKEAWSTYPEPRINIADTAAVIRSALAAPPAEAVPVAPAGWQCVPVEPTPEMIVAGEIADDGNIAESPYYAATAIYRAMLAAAPPAPQPVALTEKQRQELMYEVWIRYQINLDHDTLEFILRAIDAAMRPSQPKDPS